MAISDSTFDNLFHYLHPFTFEVGDIIRNKPYPAWFCVVPSISIGMVTKIHDDGYFDALFEFGDKISERVNPAQYDVTTNTYIVDRFHKYYRKRFS